jgi:serine/threonine protein kinase
MGMPFLLYKKMDTDAEKMLSKLSTPYEKAILLYRCAMTTYAFLYSSLSMDCFHKDIKPANILVSKTTLSNGSFDIEARVGDFGLFTNKLQDVDFQSGTPLFMCIRDRFAGEDKDACLAPVMVKKSVGAHRKAALMNEVYAYNATVLFLSKELSLPKLHEYIQKMNKAINNRDMLAEPLTTQYEEEFTRLAIRLRYVLDTIVEAFPPRRVYKHPNNPIVINANSFAEDIALHELIKLNKRFKFKSVFAKKNNMTVLSITSNGIGPDSPFIYTYLYSSLIENMPYVDPGKKDYKDLEKYFYSPVK